MRRRDFVATLALLGLSGRPTLAQSEPTPPPKKPTGDPEMVEISVTDVRQFWAAWDRAELKTRLAVFQTYYLDLATPGLQDFFAEQIESINALVGAIDFYRRYYTSVREATLGIAAQREQIRAGLRRLKTLYPEAIFPDLYFLVGNLSVPRLASPHGLLFAAEVYARTPTSPLDELDDDKKRLLRPFAELSALVVHEVVHFQQRTLDIAASLLAQSLVEGTADWLGELATGVPVGVELHRWADAHEREVWQAFARQMHTQQTQGWLYGTPADNGWPSNLGHYVGYKIAQAYYNRAADKPQAVRALLTEQNFERLLADSGYAARLGSP